jgi:hypothetical protein
MQLAVTLDIFQRFFLTAEAMAAHRPAIPPAHLLANPIDRIPETGAQPRQPEHGDTHATLSAKALFNTNLAVTNNNTGSAIRAIMKALGPLAQELFPYPAFATLAEIYTVLKVYCAASPSEVQDLLFKITPAGLPHNDVVGAMAQVKHVHHLLAASGLPQTEAQQLSNIRSYLNQNSSMQAGLQAYDQSVPNLAARTAAALAAHAVSWFTTYGTPKTNRSLHAFGVKAGAEASAEASPPADDIKAIKAYGSAAEEKLAHMQREVSKLQRQISQQHIGESRGRQRDSKDNRKDDRRDDRKDNRKDDRKGRGRSPSREHRYWCSTHGECAHPSHNCKWPKDGHDYDEIEAPAGRRA